MLLLRPLAFALGVSAVLIAPEISEADEDAFRILPIDHEPLAVPADVLSRTIALPCAPYEGCGSDLTMDFQVVDNGMAVLLNGFALYPLGDGDLFATSVATDGKAINYHLGYKIVVSPEVKGEDYGTDAEVIRVWIRIIQLGTHSVEDIAPVTVEILRKADGKLGIIDVAVEELVIGKGCQTVWCRATAPIDMVMELFRGCGHGQHHHHGHNHHGDGSTSRLHVDEHHHKHGHHRHHGGGHHHQSWARFLGKIASHIVVPVIVGITAGVTIALFAVFMCSLFFRVLGLLRGSSDERVPSPCEHCNRAVGSRVERGTRAEKSGLLADDSLPGY